MLEIMMNQLRRAAFIPAMALLTLAACSKQQPSPAPATLGVSDAVVRLPAVEGRPGAAYFTLHGGPSADRLVAISSNRVATIDLHESKMDGGIMRMAPITGADILPGTTVAFKPGGNHAMLFGIDPTVKPGETLSLHFAFQSGAALDAQARVVAAGGDLPMSH